MTHLGQGFPGNETTGEAIPEDVMQAAREVVAEFYAEQSAHEDVERILGGAKDHWSEVQCSARAILADLHRDQWQLIETAPKDGSEILVCDAEVQGGFMQVVYHDFASGFTWHTSDGISWHEDAFTHWMPLPAAPKGGA